MFGWRESRISLFQDFKSDFRSAIFFRSSAAAKVMMKRILLQKSSLYMKQKVAGREFSNITQVPAKTRTMNLVLAASLLTFVGGIYYTAIFKMKTVSCFLQQFLLCFIFLLLLGRAGQSDQRRRRTQQVVVARFSVETFCFNYL